MQIALIDDDLIEFTLFKSKVISDLRCKNVTPIHYSSLDQYISSEADHDMVICDYSMPDKTAGNFEKAINKEDCPFVIYTTGQISLMGFGNIEYYKSMGISALFQKEKDDEKLGRLIRHYQENMDEDV